MGLGADGGDLGVREGSVMMGLWRSMRRLELRWTVDDEEEGWSSMEVTRTEVAACEAQNKSIPLMFVMGLGNLSEIWEREI